MNKRLDSVIIVQARMESSRLPGKVMKELCGTPLIDHLLTRLSHIPCRGLKVAVSSHPASHVLVEYLSRKEYRVITGHPDNLYQRFLQALENEHPRSLVRVTADNPLTDTDAICRGVETLIDENLDYLWMDRIPVGCGCDIFKTDSFYGLSEEILSFPEKEHIVPIFRNRPHLTGKGLPCPYPENAGRLRLTVDTESDYRNMQRIFSEHCREGSSIDLPSLIHSEMQRAGLF